MADPTAAADAEHAAAAPAAFLLAVVNYGLESEAEESSLASHKPQNPTVSDETKLVYNIIPASVKLLRLSPPHYCLYVPHRVTNLDSKNLPLT